MEYHEEDYSEAVRTEEASRRSGENLPFDTALGTFLIKLTSNVEGIGVQLRDGVQPPIDFLDAVDVSLCEVSLACGIKSSDYPPRPE